MDATVRILFCSLEAPLPPMNGLRLQVSALVRELRREHEVRVLALRMPDQEKVTESEGMRLIEGKSSGPNWWNAAIGIPPASAEAARDLHQPLRAELEDFRPDVVHVTSGRLGLLARWLIGRPKVLAALDAWHINVAAEASAAQGGIRWLRWVEGRFVRRFERLTYRRFDRVIVVSEEDRRALLAVNPTLQIAVIPNGVDADAFDWDGTPRNRTLILFTGVMSYAPNATASEFLARRVLPRVGEAIPEATLALVGRNPSPEVRALGSLPGVEVVGEVPDLRPWLSRAGAYACPMLSGTGMKNKLLEAMANGLSCVATPLALQGLSVTPAKEVLVASSEEDVARQVGRLLQSAELADRVGSAGRAYVRTHHTWASVAAAYERVYSEVISNPLPQADRG